MTVGGRPSSGSLVAAQAWPARAKLASMKPGDSFYSPTVGWARTGPDGTYSLQVDATRLTPDFVGQDGKVNLNLVAWDASSVGRWGQTAWLGSTDEAAVLSAAPSSARPAKPFEATISLDTPRKPRQTTSAAAPMASLAAAACTPGYPYWYLLSTSNAQFVIGESLPWSSGQTGWMKTSSSHQSSIGFGVSANGTTWSLGGLHTETDGTSTGMTWPKSVYFTQYTVWEQYGKYALAYRGTTNYTSWQETEIQPTGTYGSLIISANHFPTANCAPQTFGTWHRYQTAGNSWTINAGVKLKSVIGIDLKVTSSYSTTHDLYYKLTVAGQLCGSNAKPGTASSVEAK